MPGSPHNSILGPGKGVSTSAPWELPVWGQGLATPAEQPGNGSKLLAAPCQGQDETEVSPPPACSLGLQALELGKAAAPPSQCRGVVREGLTKVICPRGQGGDLLCLGITLSSPGPRPLCCQVGCLPVAHPCPGFHPSLLTLSFPYQSQTPPWAQNPA